MTNVMTNRGGARRAFWLGVLMFALVALLAWPATAQQPYPPPPPGDPEPRIECDLRVTPDHRIAECEGWNLDPDTRITIEVTVTDPGTAAAAPTLAVGLLLAQEGEVVEHEEDSEPVEDDGTAYVAVPLDCEVDGIATIRGEGVGENGEPVSDEIVRDLDEYPCPSDDEDRDRVTPIVDEDRPVPPRLAFTGTDWLLLLVIALLLILAGAGILRSRQRRPA